VSKGEDKTQEKAEWLSLVHLSKEYSNYLLNVFKDAWDSMRVEDYLKKSI
jgi:hypothetical protein